MLQQAGQGGQLAHPVSLWAHHFSHYFSCTGLLDKVTEVAAAHGLTPFDSSLEQLHDPAINAAFNTKGGCSSFIAGLQ